MVTLAKKGEELNFWKTLESIKKTINLWKWRGLSLIGRIQIVKTFAIPKLMFRASAISISKYLVKEAESIFYHFIWKGKDKVKRNAVISEVENGGLNMLDTESMIRTKPVICLQKLLGLERSIPYYTPHIRPQPGPDLPYQAPTYHIRPHVY